VAMEAAQAGLRALQLPEHEDGCLRGKTAVCDANVKLPSRLEKVVTLDRFAGVTARIDSGKP
jgi:hypothetical protein